MKSLLTNLVLAEDYKLLLVESLSKNLPAEVS